MAPMRSSGISPWKALKNRNLKQKPTKVLLSYTYITRSLYSDVLDSFVQVFPQANAATRPSRLSLVSDRSASIASQPIMSLRTIVNSFDRQMKKTRNANKNGANRPGQARNLPPLDINSYRRTILSMRQLLEHVQVSWRLVSWLRKHLQCLWWFNNIDKHMTDLFVERYRDLRLSFWNCCFDAFLLLELDRSCLFLDAANFNVQKTVRCVRFFPVVFWRQPPRDWY